jgi:hypothetical protein
MRMKTKIKSVVLMGVVASILLPFFTPQEAQAAPTGTLVEDMPIPEDVLIEKGRPNANSFLANTPTIDFGTYNISASGNVTDVVFRPKGATDNSKDIPLTNTGGNSWKASPVTGGTPYKVSIKEVAIPPGIFSWFRDPGDNEFDGKPKTTWMYDLDGKRNYFGTSTFIPTQTSIPPESCRKSTGVDPSNEYGDSIYNCNNIQSAISTGSIGRETDLAVSWLFTQDSDANVFGQWPYQVSWDKVANLKPEAVDFVVGSGNLQDPTVVPNSPWINPGSLWATFNYGGTFDIADSSSQTSSGLVADYTSRWLYTLTGEIYLFPIYEVWYNTGGAPPVAPVPIPGPAVGPGGCTPPQQSQTTTAQQMDPQATGVVKADQRGSSKFNVLDGIPTSENLFANVLSNHYLFKYKFDGYKGTCDYQITVTRTYNRSWTETYSCGLSTCSRPRSDAPTVSKTYPVSRAYSYWTAPDYEVYKLSNSIVNQYALPGGKVTLTPQGYTPPPATYNAPPKHIYEPSHLNKTLPNRSLSGGSSPPPVPVEDWKPDAEGQVAKVQVQNDHTTFKGNVVMNSIKVDQDGPAPGTIAMPTQIDNNTLYQSGLKAPPTLLNKDKAVTTGTVLYIKVVAQGASGNLAPYTVNAMNTVTVHTPVVNYSSLPDINRPYDQSMQPNMSNTVLVLGRDFQMNFNESGQHNNYLGYGNNTYTKYTQKKRIMYPFDVWNGATFVPANTWIDMRVGTPTQIFNIPVWVPEGDYNLVTESFAINAASIDSSLCQTNSNGNLTNYCATQTIPVHVVGRLFGFRVWDIGDLRYQSLFRTTMGQPAHSDKYYVSGGNDRDGQPTSFAGKRSWILPIRAGSYPGQLATVPHNGYPFLFDFETIGDLWDKGQGVRLDPTFWFHPKTGGSAQKVDLYYNTSGDANKFIKVGSTQDAALFTRTQVLADSLRNVDQTEINDAASYEYNNVLTASERTATPWAKFYTQYLARKTTTANGYSSMVLSYKARTLIGPTAPAPVNSVQALRSVQHWFGEYNLPIAPYILPVGTDLHAVAQSHGGSINGKESEFLDGGYITVNFRLSTVKNNDVDTEVLGYIAPNENMWKREGIITSSTDYLNNTYNYNFGDVIMFESDFSVRDDFQGVGQ